MCVCVCVCVCVWTGILYEFDQSYGHSCKTNADVFVSFSASFMKLLVKKQTKDKLTLYNNINVLFKCPMYIYIRLIVLLLCNYLVKLRVF